MRLWPLFTSLFFAALSACRALPQEPQKPSEPPPTSQGSAPAQDATVLLKEGTLLNLKLLHNLNSKTVVLNDPLNFGLAEDVVLNGKTLVKAGAPAIGRVRQAKPARTLGRGAELGLEMQYLKVGRTRVPLRGSQLRGGEGKTAETVTLTILFGVSGLIKHGSEVEVKEGSLFTAYVDQDTPLPAPPESPAAATK
jgi:hypothetical protein